MCVISRYVRVKSWAGCRGGSTCYTSLRAGVPPPRPMQKPEAAARDPSAPYWEVLGRVVGLPKAPRAS